MTKREFLTMVTENNITSEVVEFAKQELEKIDTRNQNRKPTKTQIENEGLVKTVYEVLSNASEPLMVKELVLADDRLSEYSYQKISAMVKKLVDSGKVVKTINKKNSYFSVNKQD